jgi:hypothetical protein
MAKLFLKGILTINEHIKNIFKEGELSENSVIRKFRITARDGKAYEVNHYDLDVDVRLTSNPESNLKVSRTSNLLFFL